MRKILDPYSDEKYEDLAKRSPDPKYCASNNTHATRDDCTTIALTTRLYQVQKLFLKSNCERLATDLLKVWRDILLDVFPEQ